MDGLNLPETMSTYLITGASGGIGREAAISLSNAGHTLVLLSRNEEALQETASLCSGTPLVVPCDLTDPESTRTSVDWIKNKVTSLSGILHNAGLLINKPFSDLTDEDWRRHFDVNLMAPVRLTRELLPHLASPSHLVLISSMGGFQGSAKFPGLSAYSSLKGGLSILAETLAVELADRKIRANALCLGAVQTDMLQEAFPGFDAPITATEMGRYVARFLTEGDRLFNGKILPVSLADPD